MFPRAYSTKSLDGSATLSHSQWVTVVCVAGIGTVLECEFASRPGLHALSSRAVLPGFHALPRALPHCKRRMESLLTSSAPHTPQKTRAGVSS